MFVVTLSVTEIIQITIFSLVILCIIIGVSAKYLKQRLCKHENISENRACHAICRKCDKDLGFIEEYRKNKQKDKL